MITSRNIWLVLIAAALLFNYSCKQETVIPPNKPNYIFTPAATDTDVQTALSELMDGDTIYFAEGHYVFTSTLTMDKKSNIVFMGEGRDKTFFSFEGQTSGEQSILGTGLRWVIFRDFTITDPPGNGIQVNNSNGITFLRVGVTHSNAADSTNGKFGIFPLNCQNVLIDSCIVTATSDAGIYVRQSKQVIVQKSELTGDVCGIEIDNSFNVDVKGNISHHNVSGILLYNYADSTVMAGNTIRVFNNTVDSNDLKNFAPVGTIISEVPTGSGIMLLSADIAEVFNNTLKENNIMGIGMISHITFEILNGLTVTDTSAKSSCKEINIHDNTITSSTNYPPDLNAFSDYLLNVIFNGGDVPDILYDGYVHPDFAADTTKGICIKGNGNATFANFDMPGLFTGLNDDLKPHDCSGMALTEVLVIAPAY